MLVILLVCFVLASGQETESDNEFEKFIDLYDKVYNNEEEFTLRRYVILFV